ncbi:hypothetical protein HPP92_022249 [Vanilla planifolia]|uniref:Uncharacterized protein n=1 Tax=Vanilla planifolia TaxID=51239 RepID=A0A835PW40_VANPL|nr:hypothetical protein HPP92_022249 [Vanilla planifolia]
MVLQQSNKVELTGGAGGHGGDRLVNRFEGILRIVRKQGMVLQQSNKVGAAERAQIRNALGLERLVVGGKERKALVHRGLKVLKHPRGCDERGEGLAARLLE